MTASAYNDVHVYIGVKSSTNTIFPSVNAAFGYKSGLMGDMTAES